MNNVHLNNMIKKFYMHECSAKDLADVYFYYKYYSAAATFYNIEINDNINSDANDLKSYCLYMMAKCYFNQQHDHNYSKWQLEIIIDLCKESLALNIENLPATILLGYAYMYNEEYKNTYFCFQTIINNIDKITFSNPSEFINIINIYFNICEYYFMYKYDDIIKKIITYVSTNDLFSYEDIKQIFERINQHKQYIPEDELQFME